MGKKPGLGLALLILVGLPVSGCRSPSSVGPPPRPWPPPPNTAQGTNGNPAQRPATGIGQPAANPAAFPAPAPATGFNSAPANSGMSNLSGPTTGPSGSATTPASAGLAARPSSQQPGDPMPLSSLAMPAAPTSLGTQGTSGGTVTRRYTDYPHLPGADEPVQHISVDGPGVPPPASGLR